MKKEEINIQEELKRLVLARLKTINPDAKIMLGTEKRVSVKELISHVEKGDDFGKKVIYAQINMLKILTSSA